MFRRKNATGSVWWSFQALSSTTFRKYHALIRGGGDSGRRWSRAIIGSGGAGTWTGCLCPLPTSGPTATGPGRLSCRGHRSGAGREVVEAPPHRTRTSPEASPGGKTSSAWPGTFRSPRPWRTGRPGAGACTPPARQDPRWQSPVPPRWRGQPGPGCQPHTGAPGAAACSSARGLCLRKPPSRRRLHRGHRVDHRLRVQEGRAGSQSP